MHRITVYDGPSLYAASEAIAKRFDQQQAKLDYAELKRLAGHCHARDGRGPSQMDLAIVSVDRKSDSQDRFTTALERLSFTVKRVDYRNAFVSVPPGRHPGDNGERSVISLASQITYIAGRLSHVPDAQLIVVSHSFEILEPLQDLARNATKGLVGIAYFSSLIDFRFQTAGFLDPKPHQQGGVRFYDLDRSLNELFGGQSVTPTERQTGEEVYAKIGR